MTRPYEAMADCLLRAQELLQHAVTAPRVEGVAVHSPTRCSLLSEAVAALLPPAQGLDVGQPAATHSQALQTAQHLTKLLLDRLQTPLPDLFAGLGGAPAEPPADLAAAGAEEQHATALQLKLLQRLVPYVGHLPVPSSSTQQQHTKEPEHGSKRQPRAQFVGIIEIQDVTDAPEDAEAADAATRQALSVGLLLACATFVGDMHTSSNGRGTGSSSIGEEPSLLSPWMDAACAEAAAELLHTVTQHSDRPAASKAAQAAAADAPLPAEQLLLAASLPALLEQLQTPLFAQQRHQRAMDRGEAEPYRGPSIFERAIAARRLAWLTRQLPRPLLSDSHATTLLPLLLAAADDPSPAVQRSGQLGLLHLAQVAQHGSLSWQRELLLDFCERMVAGCDEGVWDSALAAAAALVQAVEGKDPRAHGYHTLMQALLTEVERSGHRPVLRLQFMHVLQSQLLPALGLCLVRHFARLMPLLLHWVHAHDLESRVAALHCIAGVTRQCWPRMPVHVPLIWRHLMVLAQQEDAGEAARTERQQQVAGAPDNRQIGGVPSSHAAGSVHTEGDNDTHAPCATCSTDPQLLDAVGAVAAALVAVGGVGLEDVAGEHAGGSSENGPLASHLLHQVQRNRP